MTSIRYVITASLVLVLSVVAVNPVSAQETEVVKTPEKSPLLKEPTTPEELFDATLLMVDLARLDLAVTYLEKFENSAPDDELLIKLRDRFGLADFLKLARTRELQPRSTQLLERMNEVSRRQAEDPGYVDSLIRKMIEQPERRDVVITELRNAGAPVVPEMLRLMSRDDMRPHQETMVIALTKMGRQVIPPLIGALDTPDEQIRESLIGILSSLKAAESVPYLWYPAFDEGQPAGVQTMARQALAIFLKGSVERSNQLSSVEAASELRRLARLLYRQPRSQPVNEDGTVVLWVWNDALGTVSRRTLSPEDAALELSTRFARQSLAISPDQPEVQQQYLASLLGLEVARIGWERPRVASPDSAMYLALTAGEDTVVNVLKEGLEAGQPGTSVAALEVLSQIGGRDLLTTRNGLKSPVTAALNAPDLRVQFAAAVAVLKLEPRTGFNGSNRVVNILARATADPGGSRVIVIDSDGVRGSATSQFVTEGGYEGVVALTGREGFELAVSTSGVEAIVVHTNTARWGLSQTLANFRADARTAMLPIAVYGPSELRSELARQVARMSPATYVDESASASDFLSQIEPFLKVVKTPPLSTQERKLQKSAAVYWLATIGSGPLSKIFNIAPTERELLFAVEDDFVARNALIALGTIGTQSVQQRLAEISLSDQTDDGLRLVAADRLAAHIQKYSLLLKSDEITNLESVWNSTDKPALKQALAIVIGLMKPNATAIGERMKNFRPVPPDQAAPPSDNSEPAAS